MRLITGDSFAKWAPSGLLLIVAAVHLCLVLTVDLTPWRGGGFAMFSTLDASGWRMLSCEAVNAKGEPGLIFWTIPGETIKGPFNSPRRSKLRTWPTPGRLRRLADEILASSFVQVGSYNTMPIYALPPPNTKIVT